MDPRVFTLAAPIKVAAILENGGTDKEITAALKTLSAKNSLISEEDLRELAIFYRNFASEEVEQ